MSKRTKEMKKKVKNAIKKPSSTSNSKSKSKKGLGKRIVSGVENIVQTRQDNKTQRTQARQASYADRTYSKAMGGKWSPESTEARWTGIAGMSGSIADATSQALGAYFTGGASSALGGLGETANEVLGALQDGGIIQTPEPGQPDPGGGEADLFTQMSDWAAENPGKTLVGGGLILYGLTKVFSSSRKSA